MRKLFSIFLSGSMLFLSACNGEILDKTSATSDTSATVSQTETTTADTTVFTSITETAATVSTSETQTDVETEDSQLLTELKTLITNYSILININVNQSAADKTWLSADGEYVLYEFPTIKSWNDFEELVKSVFTEDGYNEWMSPIENESELYIRNVDGKIGKLSYISLSTNELFLPDCLLPDSIKITSHTDTECSFTCDTKKYLGSTDDTIEQISTTEFSAIKDTSGWKLINVSQNSIKAKGLDGDIIEFPQETDNFIDGITYFEHKYDGSYNTIENAELFDERLSYVDENNDITSTYIRAAVGDKFGSLTLTDANISFQPMFSKNTENGENITAVPAFAEAYFDGEVTLKGLLIRFENDHPVYGGELMFLPFADSAAENDLPFLHYYTDGYVIGDFTCHGYSTFFDLQICDGVELPAEIGEKGFAVTEVTLSDIIMQWSYGNGSGYSPYSAKLTAVNK